ncbi:MAG: beta-ketoacyl-[acyl-carrier-protein] synthase family protein [Candidatus Binatia bacterium]|nr:beta-ketoacyl-[acyl-carrier-protein] synthase family protein [Candidatus Binatia bacterium]
MSEYGKNRPDHERVVVTGVGVVAPNAIGARPFAAAVREGRSGIRKIPKLEELKFGCHVAGVPEGVDELAETKFASDELLAMNTGHRYGCLAALEAWEDAGLERPGIDSTEVDWDTGAVIGTGIGGMDTIGDKVVPFTDAGKVRRLGSTAVEQVMASGISARVSGLLALGNQVTTNSSACSTGTEAILEGAQRIRSGQAQRMLCGGTEGASHYVWAGFDAMRVLNRGSNAAPAKASRPMSASAGGFIPGSGAGVLVLESLPSALERGATIQAEVLGGMLNCGGHRGGGSMTAPNPDGVRRCIQGALRDAAITPEDVDAINGHLTATGADPREVKAWAQALECNGRGLPLITSTKSMVGHCLGAAGAIECVASILMLREHFIHPSINCEDVHDEIVPYADSIPHTARSLPDMKIIAKAGFGFGDVNSCIVLGSWED